MFERNSEALSVIPVVLGLAELARRLAGTVPHDLTAYLAAAEVVRAGNDPYGAAISFTPAYKGFPYVYPPWTLPILSVAGIFPPLAWSLADWLFRVGIILWSCRWLGRQLKLSAPLALLVTGAVLFTPVAADTFVGNLGLLQFGAYLLVARRTALAPSWADLSWAVPATLVASVKLIPLIPLGALVVLSRRWRLCLGLAIGISLVAGLTWIERGYLPAWWSRLQQAVAYWATFDLYSISIGLWIAVAIAWGTWCLRLAVARDPRLWLWCCVSFCAWPRLQSYSLIMAGPPLLHLWQRSGPRVGWVLLAPMLFPLPILVDKLAAGWLARALYTVWMLGLTGLLWWDLRAPGGFDGASAPATGAARTSQNTRRR